MYQYYAEKGVLIQSNNYDQKSNTLLCIAVKQVIASGSADCIYICDVHIKQKWNDVYAQNARPTYTVSGLRPGQSSKNPNLP
jgi:hypothetical protein